MLPVLAVVAVPAELYVFKIKIKCFPRLQEIRCRCGGGPVDRALPLLAAVALPPEHFKY